MLDAELASDDVSDYLVYIRKFIEHGKRDVFLFAIGDKVYVALVIQALDKDAKGKLTSAGLGE